MYSEGDTPRSEVYATPRDDRFATPRTIGHSSSEEWQTPRAGPGECNCSGCSVYVLWFLFKYFFRSSITGSHLMTLIGCTSQGQMVNMPLHDKECRPELPLGLNMIIKTRKKMK